MAKQETISFFEFTRKFNNEETCRNHLFRIRWPEGFECPKCKNKTYYLLKKHNRFQCTACKYQASVTAGTIMDRTRIPLVKWFWAMYLVGTDKRGYSALSLSREMDISYKAAWFLLQRIRKAMMDRDWDYSLSGTVELDDAFFGSSGKGGKRGRGTSKTKVIVGLSVNSDGLPDFIKMEVLRDLRHDTIAGFAHINIKEGSVISTDAYRSYIKLTREGYGHQPKVFDPKTDSEHLKWLHTIVSNAKAFINGTFHGLDGKHLPLYLAEFCFRFNRRRQRSELFNRIVRACSVAGQFSYAELTL